ncbi:hypothetical protein M8J77_023506 [Diaphorina citri]|nr:hypothetical protein M8J77_023506 [Diaphorina citri]
MTSRRNLNNGFVYGKQNKDIQYGSSHLPRCQPKVITLGLFESLTKNADPVCTREKAEKKKNMVLPTGHVPTSASILYTPRTLV